MGRTRESGRRTCPAESSRAFTLIELLVVIAIISVLAALLVPSLRRAHGRATAILCASNLRQVILGAHMYTHDHEGMLPVTSNATSFWTDMSQYGVPHAGDDCYQTQVAEYMGVEAFVGEELSDVFRCPAVPRSADYAGQSWNYKWAGAFDTWFYPTSFPGYFRRNIDDVLQPMILAGDTADGVPLEASKYLLFTPEFPDPYFGGGTTYGDIGNRHNDGMNTAWHDGHVQYNTRRELWENQLWYVGWLNPKAFPPGN